LDTAPPLLDPFAGGGSIPIEAQRIGLKSIARDLNPIAVILNKALIEIPFLFKDTAAVNPNNQSKLSKKSEGFRGLAEDINYYGGLLKEKVKEKVGKYYPKIEYRKKQIPVVAWIWARTINSPDPRFSKKKVPLVKSFWLCKKKGKEVWIKPLIDKEKGTYTFSIETEKGKPPEGTISKNGGKCILSDSPISYDYIRKEGKKGKLGQELIAIVGRHDKRLVYMSPSTIHKHIAGKILRNNDLTGELPKKALGFRVQLYGLKNFFELFSNRQYITIKAFIDVLSELREIIEKDSIKKGKEIGQNLADGGNGAKAYSEAIIVYLTLAIGRMIEYNSMMTYWDERGPSIAKTFSLPTLQMRLSYPETNPFEDFSGNWDKMLNSVVECIKHIYPDAEKGTVQQYDATAETWNLSNILLCTDPPYYDNIGYANLSDFFYVWLRNPLKKIFPNIFSTLMTPKDRELIAEPARHNSKEESSQFFENGLLNFAKNAATSINKDYPIAIYYAFKQSEINEGGISSTGWETFLSGLINSNLQITATVPMRTEQSGGLRMVGRNSLASSIIVVCRVKDQNSALSTRREFIKELKKELPSALKNLQEAGISPVDMAQSAIGPGMAVFSRYSKVLEADGNPMSVRTALQIINQELDSFFSEQESDMDRETRFCVAWYEQFGWKAGPFGDANTLSTAKGTAVNALETAGVLSAKAGKVRLLKRSELDDDWDPTTDKKLTVWECVQHLIKRLEEEGEVGAANILRKIGGLAEPVKELTYRLYSMCEKKGWTKDGLEYNKLIQSWQSVTDKAQFAEQVSEETKKKLKDKSQKTLKDL